MQDIHALRKQLRNRRKELSAAEIGANSRRIIHRLIQLPAFVSAIHIALYYPIAGEVDPLLLFKLKHRFPSKRFYFPVIDKKAVQMAFYQCDQLANLRNNYLGIPEPRPVANKLCKHHNLDLVIVPLVGFDQHKQRIGMGGGYYDRAFSFRLQHKNSTKPILTGLAHPFQQIAPIQPAPWDVPLDFVITPEQIIR